jgi:glycine/D-amino acid oxidase-like deaminating enzyme
VLPGYQPEVEALSRRYGLDQARRLFAVSLEAIDYLERLVHDERIDCGFIRSGGLTLAAKPQHRRALERSQRFLREALGYRTELLARDELSREIESDRYHGGLLDPAAGSLHPARYLQGLVVAAERAGAVLAEATRVEEIRREGLGFAVRTSRGTVRAREVVVATDGYTGSLVPWLSPSAGEHSGGVRVGRSSRLHLEPAARSRPGRRDLLRSRLLRARCCPGHYLGAQVAQAIAGARGLPELSGRSFPAIPLYRGRPWFLPLVGAYYRMRDWLG